MAPWWDNTVAYFRNHRTLGQLFWALTATLRKFSMHVHLMQRYRLPCVCQPPLRGSFAVLFGTAEGAWYLLCLYNSEITFELGKGAFWPARWWVTDKVEEQLRKLNVLVRILKPLENCKANTLRQ